MSLNMIDGETDLLDLSYRGLLSYDERYKLSGKFLSLPSTNVVINLASVKTCKNWISENMYLNENHI